MKPDVAWAALTVLLVGLLLMVLAGCAAQSQPVPPPVNIRGEIDPDYLRQFSPSPKGWHGEGETQGEGRR